MTACNARPPEGHPLHNWGVACHLPAEHVDYQQAHSWDIDAVVARHEILTRSLDALRAMFPDRKIERFEAQLSRPLIAYDVDSDGKRVGKPYRMWDLPAGPWLCVTFDDGEEYAIWKETGHVYRVGSDGAVEEDPIIEP